ncbi:MAG: hypothetical protein ACREE1_00620 [Stellaceae bacterium]
MKDFGVRMKPSGAASWLVQYRTKEGRTRRLAISKVGCRLLLLDALQNLLAAPAPRQRKLLNLQRDALLGAGGAAEPLHRASPWGLCFGQARQPAGAGGGPQGVLRPGDTLVA